MSGRARFLSNRFVSIAATLLLISLGVVVDAERDPHRPPCASHACEAIQDFLKQHYCSEFHYTEGPEEGCEITAPSSPGPGVQVIARAECSSNQVEPRFTCQQHGEPPAAIRAGLTRLLRRLGLRPKPDGITTFTVWQQRSTGWWLAEAQYTRLHGDRLDVCQATVAVDPESHIVPLRSLRFRETDADVPSVTQWTPLALADVNGDGNVEVVLQGDAYENHWLEVMTFMDRSPRTIFSGLGYWL